MNEEQINGRDYRSRAKQLRALAELDDREKIKATLIEIALDYECMAETMDALDRTNRSVGKSQN